MFSPSFPFFVSCSLSLSHFLFLLSSLALCLFLFSFLLNILKTNKTCPRDLSLISHSERQVSGCPLLGCAAWRCLQWSPEERPSAKELQWGVQRPKGLLERLLRFCAWEQGTFCFLNLKFPKCIGKRWKFPFFSSDWNVRTVACCHMSQHVTVSKGGGGESPVSGPGEHCCMWRRLHFILYGFERQLVTQREPYPLPNVDVAI